MKAKNNLDLFLTAELVLCFIIMFSTLFEMSQIASLCFSVSFVVVFLGWIVVLCSNVQYFKSAILPLVIIFLTFLFLILDVLFYGSIVNLSFSYLNKAIFFITTIIFVDTLIKQQAVARTVIVIKYTLIASAVLILASYYLLGNQKTIGLTNKYLTMNFSNPNLLSLWLSCIAIYIGLFAFKSKNPFEKVFLLICLILLTFLVFKTGSRNGIMGVIFFLVFLAYFGIFNKKRGARMKKWLIWLVVLLPLILAIIYLSAIELWADLFSFFADEGKGIESRLDAWRFAVDNISIIANYFYCSGGTGAFQLHNTHLDILCSYGVIVFILVMIYFYSSISKVNNTIKTPFQLLSLLSFCIIWFMGTFEAAIFSGGQGIFIFSCVFLLLAKYEYQDNNVIFRIKF